MRGRAIWVSIGCAVTLGSAAMGGCSSERSLDSDRPDALLFVSVVVPYTTAIDVIDTGSDSVLQRIIGVEFDLHTTRDGAYLVTFFLVREISVLDVSTLTEVASTATKSVRVTVTSDPPRVIGWSDDSVFVYSLPQLDRDTAFAMEIDHCRESRDAQELYLISRSVDTMAQWYRSKLVRVSAKTFQAIDSFPLESPLPPTGLAVADAKVSANGNRLFLRATDGENVAVHCFDIETGRSVFRTPIGSELGGFDETPDGHELWVVQSFPSEMVPPPPELGNILILDSRSGLPLDTIHTVGLRVGRPDWTLPITLVTIHPDGRKAYVTSYQTKPALLVIDVPGRSVVKTLYGDVYTNVLTMALAKR